MNTSAIMKAVWFTPGLNGRWGLPILFQGPPGTGKSRNVEQTAANCGLRVETIIASLSDPTEIGGFPFANDGCMTRMPPSWAYRMEKAKDGICFFDEINTAPPACQAALLRVILDGVVGDLDLGPGVRMVGAMNRTEESAGGWDLAPPLANRFGHLKWETPDPMVWSDWLLGGASTGGGEAAFTPKEEEKRVLKLWNDSYAKSRGLISGFIRARPELLFMQPKQGSPQMSGAWPSPRTWDMAVRALAGCEIHGLGPVDQDELLSAFVGVGAASELIAFVQNADLPEPGDVLDGKVKFQHDPRRLDRTVAVFSSCAALVTSPTAAKRNERAGVLWKLMGEVMKDAADLTVPAGRALVKARLHSVPEARSVLVKLQPILSAAGISA
jgi:hypothetical protein